MAKQAVVDRSFDIIALSPGKQRYYPASMKRGSWMGKNHVPHDRIDIPLGKSRYGGPVVDLPPGVQYPKGLRFAAQLNLADVAPHDVRGLLPTQGHLIVFAANDAERGRVVYADVSTDTLERTVVEHEDNFFEGVLIEGFKATKERWQDRFGEGDGEDQEEGPVWDYFAGAELSKVYGIVTHCQWSQKKVEKVLASDQVVLLQIGEGGFNDEGVFTVLIAEEALRRRDFSRCKFLWAQS